MRDVNEWLAKAGGVDKPWLVLGDGPTLSRSTEFDLASYGRIALGPTTNGPPVDAIILADPQPAKSIGEGIGQSAVVLVPRVWSSLAAFRTLEAEGRLVVFDPPMGTEQGGAGGVISLLGSLGVRKVRTLGVDPNPSACPPALVPPAADREAEGMAAAIQRYDLDCGPLTCDVPARVFIGTDETQMLGAKILEYTVRRHSTLTVTFDAMQHVKSPMPKDPKNQPRTEFSFSRFAIPKLAGYTGRGLYVDADMQVFHDLRELWEMPFVDGSTVMYAPPSDPKRSKQTSVMLLDCNRLRWDLDEIVRSLDEGRYGYAALMGDIALEPEAAVRPGISTDWNSLEEYVPGRTRLLHYTDTNTQPWVSRRNRNGDLWIQALCDALRDGAVTETEIQEAARLGQVRPSLPMQLRVKPQHWPLFRRLIAPVVDVRYKPHRQLRKRLGRKPL